MGGPAFDCFSNPLGAVRLCFDKACSSSSGTPPYLSQGDFGVQDLFRHAVLENGGLSRVPEINSVPLDAIPANSLVRFRGMVQDMFDMEYYVGSYKDGDTWRINKYADASSIPLCLDKDMQIWERRPYYCIPVPGENSWVKSVFATQGFKASHMTTSMPPRHNQKRPRETCTAEAMETDESIATGSNDDKRLCQAASPPSELTAQSDNSVDLNMPLSEEHLAPCLVKIYDGPEAELKLNDIVEFIGVLTFDPELSRPISTGGEDPDSVHAALLVDDVSAQLPASKVPRLHCILYRKLTTHKLLSSISDYGPDWAGLNIPRSDLKVMRSVLLDWLTEVLAGDNLAAEYLLLHLLSQVHARVEPLAVGKLSLNISDWNVKGQDTLSNLTNGVAQTIAMLLPCSHLMPLSLEYLNKSSFAPRKNYSKNRLTTGALQLADGTHLILDETAMATGHLTETGLRNVHVLRNLMEWQKVEYDFEFYKMDMPADIPVLVLSTAKSRLFPADVVIPFRPTTTTSTPLLLDAHQLLNLRLYLNTARAGDHAIEPSMQKVLEEDLVAARQKDRSLGTEVFHRWLTLGRLLSLSFGETTLTMEKWQMVRELEKRLCQRSIAA